jgi:hypothetical protein
MGTKTLLLFVTVAIATFAHPADAATIKYDHAYQGGSSWQTTFTVINDGSLPSLEEFTIYFGYGTYDSLSLVDAPAGWDALVVQPDPGIPDGGFFDALSLTGGLPNGQAAWNFTVAYHYFGFDPPGSQSFTVIDPVTFATLEAGRTSPSTVPLPASLPLLFGSLLWLGRLRRKEKRV